MTPIKSRSCLSRVVGLLRSGYCFSLLLYKKTFLFCPGGEAEEKSFLFCCSVFSCPAKSSFTVSEEPEKMFDFGSRGEFLFHFFNGII